MSILAEAVTAFTSLFSGDWFSMKSAVRTNGMWIVGTAITLLGGIATLFAYRMSPWLERNLEKSIIIYTYLVIAGIIFWGVVDRFVFSNQQPWSTTIPPLLFMIMAWFGCSYNVKLRTHLSFSEFRSNMPRPAQFAVLTLDAILWFVFCVIVVTTTIRATVNSASNFQIVQGTDDTMQWWFIITVPIAFTLMAGRVMENWLIDRKNFREGNKLIEQAVIGGDA
ncbi:MAG: TRAP transporter small permease subunit [Pseudomonadota bacterium]